MLQLDGFHFHDNHNLCLEKFLCMEMLAVDSLWLMDAEILVSECENMSVFHMLQRPLVESVNMQVHSL